MAEKKVLSGPWDQMLRLLDKMPGKTRRSGQKALSSIAFQYGRYWKRALRADGLSLPAKHPLTLLSMGGKTTPLIAKGKYVASIRKNPIGNKSDSYYVGVWGDAELMRAAWTNEFGAIIRPVKSKNLAIPMTVRARKYKSPLKYPWTGGRPVYKPHRGPGRSTGGLYEVLSPGGGKGGRGRRTLRITYLLMPYVVIPPRPAFSNSWAVFRLMIPLLFAMEINAAIQQMAVTAGLPVPGSAKPV